MEQHRPDYLRCSFKVHLSRPGAEQPNFGNSPVRYIGRGELAGHRGHGFKPGRVADRPIDDRSKRHLRHRGWCGFGYNHRFVWRWNQDGILSGRWSPVLLDSAERLQRHEWHRDPDSRWLHCCVWGRFLDVPRPCRSEPGGQPVRSWPCPSEPVRCPE